MSSAGQTASNESRPLWADYLSRLTLALVFFVPLILFMPFAILAPNSRRVRCFHCDYDHDFPARERR